MHEFGLLGDFVVILTVALAVAWVFSRLRLPTIVGFLAAGIILGPGVVGVVEDPAEIALLAEIGVVLLLFSIGLELSLEELRKLGRFVFGVGLAQVAVTAAVVGGAFNLYGFGVRQSIFFGLLGALSSTAIVLTSLRETDEVASIHGRGMVGVLLFQDLAVVPLIMVVPLLSGTGTEVGAFAWTLAKAGGMVVAVWLAATYVFPLLAERVVETRRRELFTLMTVVVAVGTAYLSGAAGLSLALGAFLAGLVISESPYSEQMTAEVEPFKDVFNSLFFVSMGLLVDPGLFADHPWAIFGLSAGALTVKALLLATVVVVFGYGVRVAVLVGLGVSQVGEFSFLLAHSGLDAGLMTEGQYGFFLAAAVLTMAATPFFLRYSRDLAQLLADSRLTEWLPGRALTDEEELEDLHDHVVVVGFGHNGQSLARSLSSLEIDYRILELNPGTVRRYRDREPISYGDASRETILQHAGAGRARALIVTISDQGAARQIVDTARRLNPDLFIVARTRFSTDLDRLYEVGADQVIVEEFETALELVGQTLEAYDVPLGRVLRELDDVRRHGYGAIAGRMPPDQTRARQTLRGLASRFHAEFVRIPADGRAVGRRLDDLDIRRRTGATVIAVDREGELTDHPDPEFELAGGDRALLIGEADDIEAGRDYLAEISGDRDDRSG